MSFDQRPKIDRFSRNSEDSERKLLEILNQTSGFVSRQEIPDKGCDFDVELISDTNTATNHRFPIQLKSIEKVSTVENGKFISYPFETSRLGYLMTRLPATGLVIIYSTETTQLYFDFAHRIYARLLEVRQSEDWKKNDHVNICIPTDNILTSLSTSEIRKFYLKCFENASFMQAAHAEKYSLPYIQGSDESRLDPNNIPEVKVFLKAYGLFLLDKHDINLIYGLILKITNVEITNDNALLVLASIVYGEMGLHTDSNFYITKLLKKFKPDAGELKMILS